MAVEVFFFCLAAYVLTVAGHLHTDDMWVELGVAQSMVAGHGLAVENGAPAARGIDGRGYAAHGIGASILLLPAAATEEISSSADTQERAFFAASLLPALCAAVTVAVLFLLAIDLGAAVGSGLALCFMVGFTTIEWAYAHETFDVGPTGMCLTLAVFAANRLRIGRPGWAFFAGASAGMALLLRIPTVISLPFLLLQVMGGTWRQPIRRRLLTVALWAVPVLICFAFIAWYDAVRFGNPMETGYGHTQDGPDTFTTPILVGLAGQTISPGKSLLLFSPTLLLAFIGLPAFARRQLLPAVTVVALFVANLLFYSCYTDWSGDWAWGPRYIVPVTPLLMLPALTVIEAWPTIRLRWRVGAVLLVVAGLAAQLLGVLLDFYPSMLMMYNQGVLAQSSWTPQYSALWRHAVMLWQLAHAHTQYRTTLDFWWVYAWLADKNRAAVSAAVAVCALTAAVLGATLIRSAGSGGALASDVALSPVMARRRDATQTRLS